MNLTEKQLLERKAVVLEEMELFFDINKDKPKDDFQLRRDWLKLAKEVDEINHNLRELYQNTGDDGISYAVPGLPAKRSITPMNTIGEMCRALFNNADPTRTFTLAGTTATITNPDVQKEFFMALQKASPLAALGTRFITTRNFAQFPVQTAKPEVTWFAEGDTMTVDVNGVIGAKKVEYKTAAIMLKASNFWLMDSAHQIGSEITTSMVVNRLSEAIVESVFHGTGTNQPTGLDGIAGIQSCDAGGSFADYGKIICATKKLLDANVPLENIGMVTSPEGWKQLQSLVATGGDEQYLQMSRDIEKMPKYVTTAVAAPYPGETKAYLGDFRNLMLAFDGPSVQILRERFADEFNTGFLAHLRIDIQAIRPEAFCRIDGITVTAD